MRMEATIKLSFEAEPGQPRNALVAALQRGIGNLEIGIEHGVRGAGPTGIKRGSTKVTKVAEQILD